MRKGAWIAAAIVVAILPTVGLAVYSANRQVTCTSSPASKWQAVPTEIDPTKLAKATGIKEPRIMQGQVNWVTCQEPVSVIDMQAGKPPIVKVPGHGSACAAIHVHKEGRTYPPMSRRVLVICAAPAAPASG